MSSLTVLIAEDSNILASVYFSKRLRTQNLKDFQ